MAHVPENRAGWVALRHQVKGMLDNGFSELLHPERIAWILLAALLVAQAGFEWLRFYTDSDPRPLSASLMAVIGVAVAVFMTRRRSAVAAATDTLANGQEKDGLEEERTVTTALDRLADQGWHVFHGVHSAGLDLDHVAIGPSGVYAISSRFSGNSDTRPDRIVWDRSGLSIGGAPASTEIVDHAVTQADALANALKESTGESLRVRAVVLFPNCTVAQKRPRKTHDPWVLGTQGFLKLADRSPVLLDEAQIELASFQIWRMVEANR